MKVSNLVSKTLVEMNVMIVRISIVLLLTSHVTDAQGQPIALIDSIQTHDFLHQVRYAECEEDAMVIGMWEDWLALDKIEAGELSVYGCYVARVELVNQTSHQSWVLQLGSMYVEDMEIVVLDQTGVVYEFTSGQYIPGFAKPFKQRNEPFIPLSLNKGDTCTVYFKFNHYENVLGETNADFQAIPLTDFVNRTTDRHSYLSFILGCYFILVVCALVLFITKREKLYLYYALYITIGAVFVTSYDGLLSEYVLASRVEWFKYFWVVGCAAPTMYLLYMREFLSLRMSMPLFDKSIKVVVYLSLAAIFTSFLGLFFRPHFDDPSYIIHYLIVFQMAFMLVSQFLLLPKIRKDYRIMFFVVGSFFYLGTSIYAEVVGFGTSIGIATAALVEGLIFAAGMGYRLYLENRDRFLILERSVQARTEEIMDQKNKIEIQNTNNEALLNEIHHRVKNNLQMISSLLNMQQRRQSEGTVKDLLTVTRNRVRSLGLIHEHLYREQSFSKISLNGYVEDLVNLLIETLHVGSKAKIEFSRNIKIEDADVDVVINVGLILNELVTNSIKYAFASHPNPQLFVEIKNDGNFLQIHVEDNGEGNKEIEEGFGFMIIRTLINEDGYLKLEKVEGGFVVEVGIQFVI